MSYRVRHRAIADFLDWARSENVPSARLDDAQESRDRLAILLAGREKYLAKPDPTFWKSGDVNELLMQYAVPRQVDLWRLAEHGIDTLQHYLRFLDATGRFHPGSAKLTALLREADRLATKYPAAMADSSRWKLAKRVFTATAADGLRPDSEPGALDRWAEEFSKRDAAGRREVLGAMVDEPGYATGRLVINDAQVAIAAGPNVTKHMVWPDAPCDCCPSDSYPRHTLPDDSVLAKHVAEYGHQLLSQVTAFAQWVGDVGQPLDRRGQLPKDEIGAAAQALHVPVPGGKPPRHIAELPALHQLWRLSLEFGLTERRHGRVCAGPGLPLAEQVLDGAADPEQALELWAGIVAELIHPQAPADEDEGRKRLREWTKMWTPRLLGLLYGRGPAATVGVDLDELFEELLKEQAHALPSRDTDMFTTLARVSVHHMLAQLDEHGALEVIGVETSDDDLARLGLVPDAARELFGTKSWVLTDPEGLRVRLTDLGRYHVHQQLASTGASVPLRRIPPPREATATARTAAPGRAR